MTAGGAGAGVGVGAAGAGAGVGTGGGAVAVAIIGRFAQAVAITAISTAIDTTTVLERVSLMSFSSRPDVSSNPL